MPKRLDTISSMSTTKPSKSIKASGEAGKTAIQVVERMMNLVDALAEQEESSSLKLLAEKTHVNKYN